MGLGLGLGFGLPDRQLCPQLIDQLQLAAQVLAQPHVLLGDPTHLLGLGRGLGLGSGSGLGSELGLGPGLGLELGLG